ncbi:MAG: hypothetical protein WBP81_30025 [Solirubrobacteraceae bacterium]
MIPRRSATSRTESSTLQSGKSWYRTTSSAILIRSEALDGLEREVARGQVAEEANLGLPAEARGEQVHDFGDDQSRDEQRTFLGLHEL